ncbi:NUDIX hydrolase [Desulfatitalea alkaliphila]|uniref:GDP-mannose pyrophosphatase n=1 Tax=Desulfatitalea alkaliphila TaxID=2929485 RepID=A0AA41R749_9BACT|nr:NUDIX hydrolase [Desulfatitalea alkaliphila]
MKILNATILAKVKYATLFAISYLDRKGNAKRWHLVSRGDQPKCITGERRRPDAAIIVPYHRNMDKLVVIKEFRIPVGDYLYGFPAGLLDPNETVAKAAGRELREETGLDLVRVYRHSPALFSSAGITDETIAMVFAEVEGTPTARHNADSEEIEICLMDRQEIRALLNRTEIVFSARAWLAMDAFAQQGKAYLIGD